MKGKLIAAVGLTAIAVVLVLIAARSCRPPGPQPDPPNPQLPGVTVQRETYTPPVVRLPFSKAKPPVPVEKLPIPKRDVAASVTIATPPQAQGRISLVVDKKGEIRPVEAPPGTTITITKWRAPLLSLGHHFSLGVVYCERPALVLSYDPVRIWRFRLGLDAGVYTDWKTAFAGASIKLHAFTLEPLGLKLHAVAGYEVLKRRIYVGGGISL